MGILDIFRKRPEPELISMHDLRGFLKTRLEPLQDEFIEFSEGLENQRQAVFDALDALEKASLLNENVPKKALSLLQGNKRTYIQKMRKFIKELELPSQITETADFLEDLSRSMGSFSKSTQRNYMIISEFHKDEIYSTASGVKRMESMTQSFIKHIHRKGFKSIIAIMDKLDELEEQKQKEKQSKIEREKAKHDLKRSEARLSSAKTQLTLLKNSEDYSAFQEMEKKKTGLLNKIEQANHSLQEPFSELSRPLRKHKKGSLDEDLISRYLESARAGLESDSDMRIIAALQKMEQNLPSLNIKNESRIKDILGALNKEFLSSSLEHLSNLESELEELEQRQKGNNIMEELEEKQRQIELLEQEIDRHNKSLSSRAKVVDINKFKEEIASILPELNAQLQ